METHEEGSITQWITLLRTGDEEAASRIWGRFIQRLHGLLRTRTGGAAYDEQDAAFSAFHVFCRGLANGRYPELGAARKSVLKIDIRACHQS
jgi:hypothetical protein